MRFKSAVRRLLVLIVSAGLLLGAVSVVAAPAAQAATTYTETTGGQANTWTNYTNAGGTQGPTIPAFDSIQIACRLTGFTVHDGNNWWYQIASAPWSYTYYVSADPFYNNGATSGPLAGTPFYDPNVPVCGQVVGVPETTGGVAHTWTNPANAGGTQGPSIASNQTVGITCRLTGFTVADGNNWWYQIGSAPWNNGFYVSADPFYNNGATSGPLAGTPFVDTNVPLCGTPPPTGTNETTGGVAHTWTNPANAGGTQGPSIASNQTVAIACKLTGFTVADGNSWWYLIASSPWNSQYYVSADPFYNNGATSGPLKGTPFVDPAVPDCTTSGPRPGTETTGGQANTWTNYTNAGGTQGPTIPAFTSVSITCRVTGFAVADSDSWWYQIASAPWNDIYYVSADPFYNNGATSGPLTGTPFYDPAIPICTNAPIAPTSSTAYGSSTASVNRTGCINGYYPVDCASGDFWHTFTDVNVTGRGPGMTLSRTYNDQAVGNSGLFGRGWTSTYDTHVTPNSDGSATVSLADGSTIVAQSAGAGTFTVPAWADSSLTSSGSTYTFRQNATANRPTSLYSFNSTGQLISVADLNGNTTTFSYTSGQLSSVTDSAGRTVALAVAGGLVTSATDPLGRVTTYSYDGSRDLTSVSDPAGHVTTFTYDSAGRMLTMVDPNGKTVTNSYDGSGRVLTQTDGAGLTTTYAYSGDSFSSEGGTTTITDPHGMVELQQYANGFLTQLTKAYGESRAATWTYTYDPTTFGLLSTTDPNGTVSSRTYNAAGEVLTSTDGTGHTTSTTYNSLGEPLSVTDPLGNVTTKTYDGNGNLSSVSDPAGDVTTYAYDSVGDVMSVTDPDGRVTSHTYDGNGNLASTSVTPVSGTTDTARFVSDADGEQVCAASAVATAASVTCGAAGSVHVAGTSSTVYDADGHPTLVTDALGHTTTNAYDADENLTQVTDGAGRVTTHTYDGDQRLVATTVGAGGASPSTMTNGYDLAPGAGGCPGTAGVAYCNTVTDGNGHVTVQEYDLVGNEVASIPPGAAGGDVHYSYDLAGNRLTLTTGDGKTTTYGYDADYRVTSTSYSDGVTPNVSTAYDADGRRTSMTDGTGTTTYSYDQAGRLTSVANAVGGTVGYGYDGAGDVTSLTYPNGHAVTRTFDGAGRLASVSDWLSNTTTFSYDPDGNLTSTVYPNGTHVASTFDAADQVTKTTLANSSVALAAVGYQRNGVGQIAQEADSGALTGTTNYTYDSNGRLTAAGTVTYGYDAAGNITNFAGAAQQFAANDEVTGSTGSYSTTFGYDQDGRRSAYTGSDGYAAGYGYDQAGRLTTVSVSGPAPTVTALSSTAGPAAGGTTITVTGTGFGPSVVVMFGATQASDVVSSPTSLTATVPAGTGTVDVTVTNGNGTSATTSADQYSYLSVPTVTGVSPQAGPTSGGGTVTVTGTGFSHVSAVKFGTVTATNLSVVSSTQLTVTAPAGAAGTVAVRVTNLAGTSPTATADKYTYTLAPTITAITPKAGPLAGGTTVTITGTRFTGASAVNFGATPATTFTVKSATSLTAVAPAGTGTVDITVTSTGGTSPAVTADRFQYDPVPAVTAIAPTFGPVAGGTAVTITGTGFTGATVVKFGSVKAASYTVASATSITATAPAAAAAGVVAVRVTTPGGVSASVTPDKFTYKTGAAATKPSTRASTSGGTRTGTAGSDSTAEHPLTGHPTSGASTPATIATYAYNGDGMRVSSTVTGAATAVFAYDTQGSVPLLLTDGSNNWIYGPDGVPIEQINAGGAETYYFHDAIGSTRVLTNQAGAVTGTATYAAYGRIKKLTGTTTTPIGFAGGYTDTETGFLYLINRFYNPSTGQFITIDPAINTTRTPYAYTTGDPVNRVDPNGLFPWTSLIPGYSEGKLLAVHCDPWVYRASSSWGSCGASAAFAVLAVATVGKVTTLKEAAIGISEAVGQGVAEDAVFPESVGESGWTQPQWGTGAGCAPVQQSSYSAGQYLQNSASFGGTSYLGGGNIYF